MIAINQTIGLLTVLEISGKDARCRCECDTIVTRALTTLRTSELNGKVSSCKKCMRKRAKKRGKGLAIPRKRVVREVMPW